MQKNCSNMEKSCRDCAFLTNVMIPERPNNNVMGGCFVDGHITFTDCPICKHFKEYEYGKE